jgi:hypothetical protein
MMKKLFYFLLVLFLPIALFSQNCNLSNEQQAAFQSAQVSISEVKIGNDYKSSGLTDFSYKNLIDKCVEALNVAAYCSQDDIYLFYTEILHAYNTLAYMGADAELYYCEQFIYYSNRAINAVTDPDRKEIFRRALRKFREPITRDSASQRTEKRQRDDDNYWQASAINIFGRYAEYVYSFPNGLHVSEVDNRLFTIAKESADTEHYLLTYLKILPNGNHVTEARKILDKPEDDAAFLQAQNAGTKDAYNEYLSKFPSGYHVEEINNALAQLCVNEGDSYFAANNCQSALERYTIANQYSYSYAVNSKIREAQACVEEFQLYEKIKTYRTTGDCNSYLNIFPQGKYTADVLSILQSINEEEERQFYEKTQNEKIDSACNIYITKYPDGKYIKEVTSSHNKIQKEKRRAREEYLEKMSSFHEEFHLYEKIKEDRNKSDCNSYLNRFSRGKYSADVLSILQSINEEEEQQLYEKTQNEKTDSVCYIYITKYPDGKYIKDVTLLLNKIQKEKQRACFEEARRYFEEEFKRQKDKNDIGHKILLIVP